MYERSRNFIDCNIAGFTYYDGIDVIDKLTIGTTVSLRAEPDNPYDPEAVAIYYNKTKLGYVPKQKNIYVSDLLYFGYNEIFEAKISARNPENEPEHQFRIVVKLIDNRV